jgi:hypothetical protein
MRRTTALRALTGVVFASATVFACGDDPAPPVAPAWTPDPSSIVETPVPTEEPSFTSSDPRITEAVVEGILPSPAETSASLGLAPGVWVLDNPGSWGQELEHFDFTDSGIIAGWTAAFVPSLTPAAGATPVGIFLSITFHDTSEQAERTYQFTRGEFGIQPGEGDERETVADAISVLTGDGIMIIRHQTVTAILGGMGVRAGAREFVRMLALGIDDFVRSQGP